ncbi:substrate-binding domain-containing protein [Amycolatopsis sp. YIM 10]|uniref:substrate-binding domain-containing protein n=1 Tax=Amycolatopsis sp. YIM 10 TaxID=2653857 RepID=UPI0012906F6F|nr:substrate-binding domain-containing protein [Amycolatopsis sp. YIM 10]QFU92154.1 HTH-type transcriptional regulator AscG [Amycolatopsis sp. YIM 10]
MTGYRRAIGLVTANIDLGVAPAVFSGVLAAARRHDVDLICFPGGEIGTADQPANAVYHLVTPGLVDGLICWASALGLPERHPRAEKFGRRFGRVPMVCLNGAIGAQRPLTLDSYQGMCKAIDHLIDVHDRRDLAFLQGPVRNPVTADRLRAYHDTLDRYKIRPDRALVSSPVEFRRDAGAAAMRVLLDARGLEPGRDFTGLVACSDFLAAEAIAVLTERGVRVPEDVAVIGFNDSPEARFCSPPLTSVSMPFAELGGQAVETLLSRLGGGPARGRSAPVAELVLRRSCGCAGEQPARECAGFSATVRKHGIPAEIGRRLETEFRAALAGDSSADFPAFAAKMAEGGDADAWDEILFALDREGGRELISQARIAVAGNARRLLEYERWQAEQNAQRLRETGVALSSVVDERDLTAVLARQLPLLGVGDWKLSIGPATVLTRSDVLHRDRRSTWIAVPLQVRDEPLGIGLFEAGPPDGGFYRALGEQISSAVQDIRLFREVEAAEEADSAKTSLLGKMTEELRAPVEAILRESAGALAAGPPPEVRDALNRITAGAEYQLGVLGDLLELADAELDSLKLCAGLIDPRELLAEVFGEQGPGRLPLIEADGQRLRQALLTLSRSLGHRARRTVEADVLPPHLRIRISYEGTGTPRGGLGLSIARRLIALHNGSLRFETGSAGGTFHLFLPLPGPRGRALPDEAADSLLCVADGPAPEEAVAAAGLAGLSVLKLGTGDDVAAVVDENRPAAVAWDTTALRPEHWAVLRQLHDHPKLRRTPFLAYAAAHGRDLHEVIAAVRPVELAGLAVIADPDPRAQAGTQQLIAQLRPGHLALTAPDGATALSLIGHDVPNLLILSRQLRDMDAFDVLERLHGDARLSDLPALVLSGDELTYDDVRRAAPHARTVLLGKGILSDAETITLLRRLLDPKRPPNRQEVQRAVVYLHQNYQHQITRRQVAKAAEMSEDYLSRRFHRELCVSPWEYLTRLRIARAKERLQETDDSIQAIARQVGFHDRAYFSRIFRKHTGVPPQSFRCLRR